MRRARSLVSHVHHVRGEFPGRSPINTEDLTAGKGIRRFPRVPRLFCFRSNKQLSGLNQELNRCALSAFRPHCFGGGLTRNFHTLESPPKEKSRRSMANAAGLSTIKSGTETYMTLVCASSQRTCALRSCGAHVHNEKLPP